MTKLDKPKTWETYEQVARHLLEKTADTLGLELQTVEGKQQLAGKSGTNWEVDGKGIKTHTGAVIVIECRRYTTSKVKQEQMGGFAYKISDVGAAGGIVVTPIGVQAGAEEIAKSEGIDVIRLNQDATTTDFILEFLGKVVAGRSANFGGTGTLTVRVEAVQPNEPQP